MPDYFAMMPPADFSALTQELVARVKPSNQMTPVEWAEFQVLEAIQKTEALKAEVIMARVSCGCRP